MSNVKQNRTKLLAMLRRIDKAKNHVVTSKSFRNYKFGWDFSTVINSLSKEAAAVSTNDIQCRSVGCCIGLAFEMGMIPQPHNFEIAEALGLPVKECGEILIPKLVNTSCFETERAFGYEDIPFYEITAGMVADKLEQAFKEWPATA